MLVKRLFGLSSRPRLAAHVAARLHYVSGRPIVILHDTLKGTSAQVGRREWALLRYADGTRDLVGITEAAEEGVRIKAPDISEVESFLGVLYAAGMLQEGPVELGRGHEADVRELPSERDRPVVSLPGYRFVCAGQGACCRQYPTILMSPLEVVRARAAAPERCGAGEDAYGAFTPSYGSMPLAHGPAAVAMCEGSCAYLESGGGCSIHARAGSDAKPAGCQLYPVSLVDDGESIRASVRPECRCVFDSLSESGEALLVDARVAGDFGPSTVVEVVPETVEVSTSQAVPRALYLAWCGAWCAELERAEHLDDAASSLWILARDLGAGDGVLLSWPLEASVTMSMAIRAHLESFGSAIERRAQQNCSWRAAGDMVKSILEEMAKAVSQLLLLPDGMALPGSAHADRERFYLRATLFGHQLVSDIPLREEMMYRALRLWVSRQMSQSISAERVQEDGVWADPLSLVEAVCRAHHVRIAVPNQSI